MYKVMDFDSQKTGEKLNHSENVFHEALKKKLEYCHAYKDDQPLYDPSWDHIPNYCKDCKKKFTAEKEEKQRTGAPRKIKRKCKASLLRKQSRDR